MRHVFQMASGAKIRYSICRLSLRVNAILCAVKAYNASYCKYAADLSMEFQLF